jgi:hypothetical protein
MFFLIFSLSFISFIFFWYSRSTDRIEKAIIKTGFHRKNYYIQTFWILLIVDVNCLDFIGNHVNFHPQVDLFQIVICLTFSGCPHRKQDFCLRFLHHQLNMPFQNQEYRVHKRFGSILIPDCWIVKILGILDLYCLICTSIQEFLHIALMNSLGQRLNVE